MIVISIIMSLLAIGFFPYSYYMERARLETNVDMISQEWVLSHREVQNGLLYDNEHHASLEFTFEKGKGSILLMLSTWSMSERKGYKTLTLDTNITIQGFSGTNLPVDTDTLTYTISPPYGTGSFTPSASGVILTIGYPGGTRESRRTRDILLRPYFD